MELGYYNGYEVTAIGHYLSVTCKQIHNLCLEIPDDKCVSIVGIDLDAEDDRIIDVFIHDTADEFKCLKISRAKGDESRGWPSRLIIESGTNTILVATMMPRICHSFEDLSRVIDDIGKHYPMLPMVIEFKELCQSSDQQS